MLDDDLAQQLFQVILPTAWSPLSDDDADYAAVSCTISRLLPRDDLLKQQRQRPSVVHALLGAFERCERPPDLRPELVAYVGRTFGAWHVAARLLRRAVLARASPLPADDALGVRALAGLHADLNERDVVAGTLTVRSASSFTGAALALEQYGLWPRAQEEFFNAMRAVQEPDIWSVLFEPKGFYARVRVCGV